MSRRLLKLREAAEYCGLPVRLFKEKVKVPPVLIAGRTRWDRQKLDEMDLGWVYFIRAKECARIKIGFSNCPKRRLADLQGASPAELEIIGSTRGTVIDERNAHIRFHQYRSHGEWFYECPEILAYIEELKT